MSLLRSWGLFDGNGSTNMPHLTVLETLRPAACHRIYPRGLRKLPV